MSHVTDKSTESLGWNVYIHSPKDMQTEFLERLNLDKNLPLVSWKGQLGLLDGAPPEILLQYLPKVYWLAQIKLFHDLPAKDLSKAEKLLDPRAKKKLGIVEVKKKKKRWTYTAML